MAKNKVPKLKIAWWQEILYYIFVGIIPIVLAGCEIFSSHSSIFKISFASVSAVLLAAIVIKKFVFDEKIKKLENDCTLLEHDYSIDVGNKEYIESSWATKKVIVYAYNAVITILVLVLMWLFVRALSDQLVQFNGAMVLILTSVIVGCVIKLVCYAQYIKLEDKEETVTDETGNKQV